MIENIALSAKCRKSSFVVMRQLQSDNKAVRSVCLNSGLLAGRLFFINSPQPLRQTGIESGV